MMMENKTRPTNPYGKARKLTEEPYAVYRSGSWTWSIYKTYERPDKAHAYSRAFCKVVTDMTGPRGDLGDTYLAGIASASPVLVSGSDILNEYGFTK